MISFQCPFRIYSGSDLLMRPSGSRLKSAMSQQTGWTAVRGAVACLQQPHVRPDPASLPLKQGTDSACLQPGASKSVPVISCSCWAWTSHQAQGGAEGIHEITPEHCSEITVSKHQQPLLTNCEERDKLPHPVTVGPWQSVHRCWIGGNKLGTRSLIAQTKSLHWQRHVPGPKDLWRPRNQRQLIALFTPSSLWILKSLPSAPLVYISEHK